MDGERMMPGHWLGSLLLCVPKQWLDIDGWVPRRTSDP